VISTATPQGPGERPDEARARLPPAVVRALVRLLPPIVVDAARRLPVRRALVGPPAWEYLPAGWDTPGLRRQGWNDPSVLETQRRKWPAFLRAVEGTGPLAVAHEVQDVITPSAEDYIAHNTVMAFAYVLARAAGRLESLSMLDWGSGIGHYYVLARRLLDDVTIEYYGKDVPLLCRGGRELLPEATFYEDDEACFRRTYDLVLASGSLQYTEDWRGLARRLAGAARSYLYVTRLPVVRRVASFVVLQRPHRYGYRTEYPGWILNRDEFLANLEGAGMELVREFLLQDAPVVPDAPEPCQHRGFLFRPR
jgi:putative methyltransferase (TIGR04325 family)